MKKETTHFILGILLGLLLASLLSHSSLQLPNVSRWLQSLFPVAIFATAADSPIKEEGFQENLVSSSESSFASKAQSGWGQSLTNDPRLSFLKRKPVFEQADVVNNKAASLKQLEQEKSVKSETINPQQKLLFLNESNSEKDKEPSFLNKRSKCAALFGERSFLKEGHKKLPPLLYTFPGSGNTWCRLLIEYATGIYTGSVYNDESLLKALPGEFTCNWQVSAVKAHPHTHRASELYSGQYNSDNNKCKRGNIQRFERSVLLIRDPFDSIWSEYQRRVSQSHVSGVLKEGFNWHRWQANAANLAHAYLDMWKLDHDLIERQSTSKDYLYIKYEDLKNKANRVATLQKVVDFLRLPNTQSLNQKQLMKRLECAFVLAENREAHRSIDKSLFMTKDIAYKEEIACRMWSLFSSYASKYDYKPWNNFNCTGYPKIPRINVGPQGDYDHRWVSPGQKLIDFRGKLFRNNTLITNPVPQKEEVSTHVPNRNPPKFQKRQRPVGNTVKANNKVANAGGAIVQDEGTFEEIEKMVLKKANNPRRNKGKRSDASLSASTR